MIKKTYLVIICIYVLGQLSCSKVEPINLENNFVAEAFVFASEPIDNIRLKTTFPIHSTEDVSSPINDATIELTKEGTIYPLVPTGNDGFYHYAAADLEITSGDQLFFKAQYKNRIATAQTTVPFPPTGVHINIDTIAIPRVNLSPTSLMLLREALEGLVINVGWDNPNEDWHYIVVENIETEKDPIFPEQLEEALQNFRFTSSPTQNNTEVVIGAGLRHYGTHQVKVYHINEEYADLFENSSEDSRDLNEPPSNIENALGIFTAFASDVVYFEVKED